MNKKSARVTKGEAAELIDQAMNEPVTQKQLWFIERRGLHDNPTILTKREASMLISQAKSGAGATA